MTIDDFIEQLDILVKVADDVISDDQKEQFVSHAVLLHSKNKPQTVIDDFSGDGSDSYAFSDLTFTGTSPSQSDILYIAYPASDTDETKLLNSEYSLIPIPDDIILKFDGYYPGTDEKFRMAYSVPHTVETLPEMCVYLIAALMCDSLATLYSSTSDTLISADSVNHLSKSEQYKARAKMYRDIYYKYFGINESGLAPACVTRKFNAV